jgi:hypothetical protein
VGKNNYFNVKCNSRDRRTYLTENGFGSDTDKQVLSKINILAPTFIADTWLDYFSTKPCVHVLNREQVYNEISARNGDGCYCVIKLFYKGHNENFSMFMDEIRDISKETDSYPLINDYIPGIISGKPKLEKGKLKLIVHDPFKKE